MPAALTIPESQLERFPAHTVSLKSSWSGGWVLQPYLYAQKFAKRAAPETSTAELLYKYGNVRRPDQHGYQVYAPLTILGMYVKIAVNLFNEDGELTPLTWFGVVQEVGEAREGTLTVNGSKVASGRQTFACFGLETLLAREPVRKSTYQDVTATEYTVGRAIGFNVPAARSGDDLATNRSPIPGTRGAYTFTSDTPNGQNWTQKDAVEYLLAYRTPKDVAGQPAVTFELDPLSDVLLPDWEQPRLPIHAETVRDLLNRLISRKRLVTWLVDVNETAGDQATVYAFSFAQTNITIGSGFTLEANQEQFTLDFDADATVSQAVLKRTIAQQYDQVIARGDRKGSCFSVSFTDQTLVTDWPAASETGYKTAASLAPDYATTTDAPTRQARNRLFRSADTYERVYSYFALPATWNGRAGDGAAGIEPLNPVFVVDDDFQNADTFFRPGLLLAPYLPFLTDHDYSGSNISTNSVPDLTPQGSVAERLRPMLFWQTPATITGGPQWQHAEKPAMLAAVDKHALGGFGSFTGGLRMQDRALGIVVKVSGAPQHAIARTDFTPVDWSDAPGTIDFRTQLIATVYCPGDHYLEQVFPTEPAADDDEEEDPDVANPATDYVRTLEIDFGDAYKLDYVLPGTVVGVKDGLLQRSTSGGYVRDDRNKLAAAAQVACEWYAAERQALTIVYRTITDVFQLGYLITEIGSGAEAEAVNTPITSIEWDLVAGTTTVITGFGELDLLQFSGLGARQAIAGLGAG